MNDQPAADPNPHGEPSRAVDVLIPHYNDLDGLVLALNSIREQVWQGRFRVVIVDDGSLPDVVSGLKPIADDYRSNSGDRPIEILLVENQTNRGRPYTRNVLLDHIDSPYVSWLDAGDEWYPPKIRQQLDTLDRIESDGSEGMSWVTCNYDWHWIGGKPRPRRQRPDGDQIKSLLGGKSLRAYLWTVLGPAPAFRHIGKFDERLTRLQDLDFFLRFVEEGGTIHVADTDEALCKYNKSDVGRNADEIRACFAYLFDKHKAHYQRYGRNFVRRQLYNMEMHAARFANNNNQLAKKHYYRWRAFQRWPKHYIKEEILGRTR